MTIMTRTEESTAVATAIVPTLLLAFELGERRWTLGFTTGLGQRPRIKQIAARATFAGKHFVRCDQCPPNNLLGRIGTKVGRWLRPMKPRPTEG